MELTVSSHFTHSILSELNTSSARSDLCVVEWLRMHKLSARIPLSVADDIWEYCAAVNNDELFGLRSGLNTTLKDLDVVGFLLISSSTVNDVIAALIDYLPIIGEGGYYEFKRKDKECQLIYSTHFNKCCEQRTSCTMGIMISLSKAITNGKFSATAVSFKHSAPCARKEVEQLLGCEVRYNQKVNALHFDVQFLELPITQSNPRVNARLKSMADESMEKLMTDDFSRVVSGLIRKYPAFNREMIAEKLHITSRHLSRKLSNESINFKALHNKVRVELVETWLREKVRPVEITLRLGLSSTSSFARAFKKWTGKTLSDFNATL
jgi:AraC-like DNA-binding protein